MVYVCRRNPVDKNEKKYPAGRKDCWQDIFV